MTKEIFTEYYKKKYPTIGTSHELSNIMRTTNADGKALWAWFNLTKEFVKLSKLYGESVNYRSSERTYLIWKYL
jgi:hypothetical protein